MLGFLRNTGNVQALGSREGRQIPQLPTDRKLYDNRDLTRLLYGMVDNFAKWLSSNYAHPDIAYWIQKYIKHQGIIKLRDFPMLPITMQPIAASQDLMLHGRENIPGDFTASRVYPCELSSPHLHCILDQALHHALTANTPRTMGVLQHVPTQTHRWLPT